MSVVIIDKLNKRMPNLVNKTGTEYEAIFGKVDFIPSLTITESSDYKCGAISNELELLQGFIEYQISQDDIANAEDDYLELIIAFFTTLKRLIDESDDDLRNRFDALIKRNGNLRWMTNWSFKDVFSYFFDAANLYVIENPVEDTEDEILNGDFEDMTIPPDFDNWTINESGSSTITVTTAEALVGDNAVDIYVNPSDAANIAQTVSGLTANWYKIELFYKDNGNADVDPAKITIQRSGDNYYWNPDAGDTGEWQSGAVSIDYESSLIYLQKEIYFELTDTRDITIKLLGNDFSTSTYHVYYDIIKLGAIKTYPSIKILAISVGSSSYSMAFWDNGTDPIGGTDYQYASFLDNEYIEGPGGLYTPKIYENLLEKIKVAGTKAILEINSRTL